MNKRISEREVLHPQRQLIESGFGGRKDSNKSAWFKRRKRTAEYTPEKGTGSGGERPRQTQEWLPTRSVFWMDELGQDGPDHSDYSSGAETLDFFGSDGSEFDG